MSEPVVPVTPPAPAPVAPPAPAANKRGYLTTEFYITVLTDVGLVAASVSGVLSPRWAAIAAGVAQAAYAISRGLSKVNSPAA